MKSCPHCNTQYSDDTLSYCFQDGAALAGYVIPEIPTVVLGETETVAARRSSNFGSQSSPSGSSAWAPSQVTQVAGTQPPQRSNTLVAVLVTIFGMLALFVIAGIGAVLYFRGQPVVTPTVTNLNSTSGPTVPVTVASPAYSPQPAATRSESATVPSSPVLSPADPSQVSREVSQRLFSWKSQAEALDLGSYMSHYASTVDYYRKPGASSAFVRADKQRAFSRYSSISINLSNISVSTDPSGQTATATFDKEWDFQGNGSSSGKVRQLMRLTKANGQWYIAAEKDLRVYYTR